MPENKPAKPYAGFPLFPHNNGQWAKKIRGRLHYFGVWSEPEAALNEYLRQRDELQAGRVPVASSIKLWELCEEFLQAKRRLADLGELSIRQWQAYQSSCRKMLEYLGREIPATEMAPRHFESLRAHLAKNRSKVSLSNEITRVRAVFRWGFEAGHLPTPARFGPDFRKPSKKTIRQEKHSNGKRMFEASELRLLLSSARQPLKAMILLGLNCGFGQSDIANLPLSAISDGWIDFPRPKTAVPRRCPLWPSTSLALKEAIDARPDPRTPANSHLAFLTKYGLRWVRLNKNGTPDDAVGKEMAKLLKSLEIKRKGVSFYALRHSFETIGQEAKDPLAVAWIMGHAMHDTGSHYRETVSDERLRCVTDTVYRWLCETPGHDSCPISVRSDNSKKIGKI